MYNPGKEIILESLRIPWLIWIQLFILFLLILLLSYFGLFSLDLSAAGSSLTPTESFAGVAQNALPCSQVQEQSPEAQERIAVDGDADRGSNIEGNATSMKDLQRISIRVTTLSLQDKLFSSVLASALHHLIPENVGMMTTNRTCKFVNSTSKLGFVNSACKSAAIKKPLV